MPLSTELDNSYPSCVLVPSLCGQLKGGNSETVSSDMYLFILTEHTFITSPIETLKVVLVSIFDVESILLSFTTTCTSPPYQERPDKLHHTFPAVCSKTNAKYLKELVEFII